MILQNNKKKPAGRWLSVRESRSRYIDDIELSHLLAQILLKLSFLAQIAMVIRKFPVTQAKSSILDTRIDCSRSLRLDLATDKLFFAMIIPFISSKRRYCDRRHATDNEQTRRRPARSITHDQNQACQIQLSLLLSIGIITATSLFLVPRVRRRISFEYSSESSMELSLHSDISTGH
jgi:hypothetical protein